MAQGVRAGKAFIELGIDTKKLRKSLSNAGQRLKNFAKMAAASFAAVGTAIAGSIAASVKTFVAFGDQLDKMSQRTGFTTTALSELKFAAEQSGTSLEGLGQALFRARRRIANAATETGPAARAIKELGINAREFATLNPEEQFNKLVDAFQGVENDGRRAQMAFEILGDNARDLWPLINQGTEGIELLREQARLLGQSVGPEQAANAANLADSWNEMKTTIRGAAMELGNAFAPAIANAIRTAVEWLIQWDLAWAKAKFAVQETIAGFVSLWPDAFAFVGKAFAIWVKSMADGLEFISMGMLDFTEQADDLFQKSLKLSGEMLVEDQLARLERARAELDETERSVSKRLADLRRNRKELAEFAANRAPVAGFAVDEAITAETKSRARKIRGPEFESRFEQSFGGAFAGTAGNRVFTVQKEQLDELKKIESNTKGANRLT